MKRNVGIAYKHNTYMWIQLNTYWYEIKSKFLFMYEKQVALCKTYKRDFLIWNKFQYSRLVEFSGIRSKACFFKPEPMFSDIYHQG